ncbi:MAG: DUF4255 domain-containing protein [Hydrococcus sp. SU_1_0]|nr:DUF4255 domain-containing protein [Hydrococcus sp. SU_1_0]
MFDDLDDTLKRILDDPEAPVELRNADVSFETPEKSYVPAQPTVNLFLYEVKENQVLRDPAATLERVGDEFISRKPPLRVDCSYMITAWSNQTGAVKVKQEHQLLSQVLLWLSRFSSIPLAYLQGSLANQPFPPPTMVAQIDGNKNAAGEFWTALGTSPRPTFNLIVTIAMDLSLEMPKLPVVTIVTSNLRLSSEGWFQISGKVSEVSNPERVIEEAQVKLVEKMKLSQPMLKVDSPFTNQKRENIP